MGYKVYLPQRVKEDLELCDENGEVKAVLHIDIDTDLKVADFRRAYNNFAQAALLADTAKNIEDIDAYSALEESAGLAIIELFNVLFGEENTAKIVAFYSERYTTMTMAILPFIIDVIAPAMEKANETKKEQIKQSYTKKKWLK